MAFSDNGKTLAIACNDRTIRLFDVESAKEVSHIDLGTGIGLTLLALSQTARRYTAAAASRSCTATTWPAARSCYPAIGHASGVAALVWSPDGKRLVTCGSAGDRSIIVWDAASGKILHQLPPLEGFHSTSHLQFSTDGKTLLSYGNDRTLRTWDLVEGKELHSFVTSPLAPQSFALSADGKLAAVVCADRTVRVWDVRRGEGAAPAGDEAGGGAEHLLLRHAFLRRRQPHAERLLDQRAA